MVDHPSLQTQTRKMYLEDTIAQSTVDVATTLGELHIAYKKDLYDLVIIDHTIENGLLCSEHILNCSPEQPILVVSDAIHCVITRCEDCVLHHNIRRLSNPTSIRNITRMVAGFNGYKCDHYDQETDKIAL